ncbi:MAG: hypothetical protein MK365_04130 [Vicinamibacterales bacterium]|nr:hypothetical protein [Vicinamibacterales bacterium]HIM52204.1 hypothetical protein [Acidobacteriota bacterium]
MLEQFFDELVVTDDPKAISGHGSRRKEHGPVRDVGLGEERAVQAAPDGDDPSGVVLRVNLAAGWLSSDRTRDGQNEHDDETELK